MKRLGYHIYNEKVSCGSNGENVFQHTEKSVFLLKWLWGQLGLSIILFVHLFFLQKFLSLINGFLCIIRIRQQVETNVKHY